MPNEPAESNFKDRIKATAYPCVERGGIVWAYMGPRETPPPLPGLEAIELPEGEYDVGDAHSASATGCRRSRATSTRATSASCTSVRSKPEDVRAGNVQLLHG